MIICDFCSSPNVKWRYKALSTKVVECPEFTYNSVGDWAACDECSKLIEAGEREKLLKRSVDTFFEGDEAKELPHGIATMFVQKLHDSFWLCRYGEKQKA